VTFAHFAFLHILRVSRLCIFACFVFPCISHIFVHFAFQIPRVFHTFRVSDSSHFHASHILCTFCDLTVCNLRTRISRGFRVSTYFAFWRFSHFDMRYHAPPWDPSHSIRMSCPHPPRSIGVYFTLFHLHYIIYVLAFPFMFTYPIMCLYYITLVHLVLPTRLRSWELA
jgi:hypothetical protein